MPRTPPVPPEQRSFGLKADLGSAMMDRRDKRTDAQSGQPGDADVNLKEQGRFGNLAQNINPAKTRGR